jgi:hypothetical protein
MKTTTCETWSVWVRERGGLWQEVSEGLTAREAQRMAERIERTESGLKVRVKPAGVHPTTQAG